MKCVIVGAGPAGIFAAIQCKKSNPLAEVLVLEKTNQLLTKVRISGGGRCNVTHACFEPLKLVLNYPRGSKELIGPFHTFQPKDTVDWFQAQGVSLKTEDDGRMFPSSNSSETIINCLLETAISMGVIIRKQCSIHSIEKKSDQFLVHFDHSELPADCILLATGSSLSGYALAKQLGHEIIPPVPSLFTLNVPSSNLLDLSGISVDKVELRLKDSPFRQEGPLLLTHWGFSGPAVLKLSAWAARKLHELNYQTTLFINWTASLNEEQLYQELVQYKKNQPHHILPSQLPTQLWNRLLNQVGIEKGSRLSKISNTKLRLLAQKLHADAYAIEGKTTYKQEFVTAGGIKLHDVNFKTMESRITKGLFFAGEILDIDGITGGFNFQNSWTTGFLAGAAMGLFSKK